MPHHQLRLLRELDKWVRAELEYVNDGSSPTAANIAHRDSVLRSTLLRRVDTIRARADKVGSRCPRRAKAEEAVLKLSLLNGDIRRPQPVHICGGRSCCANRDDCIAKLVAAIAESGILADDGARLPAASRWGTMGDSLEVQACGIMMHLALPTVVTRGFRNWRDGEVVAPDEEDEW